MNWTTCLAGLPEDTSAWNSLLLMRYLLLLGLLDCASGQVAVRLAGQSKIFYLPRDGYRNWCRSILQRSCLHVLSLIGIALLLSLWQSPDTTWDVVIAAAILALNAVALAGIQTLMILLFGSIAGFAPLILIQLLSLFASRYLPGAWKLLLPGNWGMAIRSTLATTDGYPLFWVIGVEILLLLLLWGEGWRLVRWHDRKDGRI